MEAGFCLARALIVCGLEASALRSRLHDMIDALTLIPCCVQECDADGFMLLLPIMSRSGLCGKCFLFFFCFCAMFSPLLLLRTLFVTSWLSEQGLFLPDVNADCFTPDVYSGDIFMSKKR